MTTFFLSAKVVFPPPRPHRLTLVNLSFLFVYNHAWYLSFEKALTLYCHWTLYSGEVEPLTVCACVHQGINKNKREMFHLFLKGLLKMLHISLKSRTIIWNENKGRDL